MLSSPLRSTVLKLLCVVPALALLNLLLLATLLHADQPQVEFAMMSLAGALMGQVALLATWTAWAPANWLMRTAGGVLALLAIWYWIAAGMWICAAVWRYSPTAGDAVVMLGYVGVMMLAMFLTVWLVLGCIALWRHRGQALSPVRGEQFSLAHLLLWTAAIAAAVALGQALLPGEGWGDILDTDMEEFALFTMTALVPAGPACGVSYILRVRRSPRRPLLLIINILSLAAFAFALYLLCVMAFVLATNGSPDDFAELAFYMAAVVSAQFSMQTSMLWLFVPRAKDAPPSAEADAAL